MKGGAVTPQDVQDLITRLERRAHWYDHPGDFRAGLKEMGRSLDTMLEPIPSSDTHTNEELTETVSVS